MKNEAEVPAKGKWGYILRGMPEKGSGMPNRFTFRVYDSKGPERGYRDYEISNYDFDVRIRDTSAVFRGKTLDYSNKALGKKTKSRETKAYGKEVCLYLNCGPTHEPFARLRDKSRKYKDYALAHCDLFVEIVDEDAALSGNFLDYTAESMEPADAIKDESGKIIGFKKKETPQCLST